MVYFKYGDPHTNSLSNNDNQYISFKRIGLKDAAIIYFKGYFKTFEDTYTSDFEETITYGRMDPIMNFKRTGRKISVSFDVVAGDLSEAKDNLFKIQNLAKFLYPNYSGRSPSLIKNSPIFRVKMMNLVQDAVTEDGLLCTLSGFSYAPNFENGAFIENNSMYSKSNTIQTTITPLHEHSLGWNEDKIFFQPNFPYKAQALIPGGDWQETAPDDPRFNKFDPKAPVSQRLDSLGRQKILQGKTSEGQTLLRTAATIRQQRLADPPGDDQ
jgi:hypothetical protein